MLVLSLASSAFAQQAPAAPSAPNAPSAPAAPGVAGQPAPQAPPQQYQQQQYPTQQAYPAPQQAYPVQGGYPPAQQPYPPQQQAYPQQGYAAQPGYAQPYPYQQPYVAGPVRRRRPSKGLLIAGISVLSASYLVATTTGVALLGDDGEDCRNCRDVGRWLFLPVVGPYVAMSQTHDGDGALWLLGLTEVVGTALLIGGIVRYRNTKRELEAAALSWDFRHQRKLSLDVSTSPMMAGPRMKLRF